MKPLKDMDTREKEACEFECEVNDPDARVTWFREDKVSGGAGRWRRCVTLAAAPVGCARLLPPGFATVVSTSPSLGFPFRGHSIFCELLRVHCELSMPFTDIFVRCVVFLIRDAFLACALHFIPRCVATKMFQ